jgi:fructose/tagatose bisphosphate aldolase
MKTPLHEIVRERLALGAAVPAISCYGASTAVSVVGAAEAAGLPVVVLVPPVLAAAVEGCEPSAPCARLRTLQPSPCRSTSTTPAIRT